jgi:hypothetical protein
METTLVLTIFKEFRDWLLGIDKANLEHNKEDKTALKSIYKALSETKSYFTDRKTMPINRERERQISNLWFDSSSELKNIDQELAVKCFLKGDFWADPDNWKQEDGVKINISIDEMTKLAKELLNK